ncbi:PDZ domain-containing protein, partial [Candidatus Dependentiae bacterium]|nr:PDZ domain-containing protein [Candidatus Dependentiae bacterium]
MRLLPSILITLWLTCMLETTLPSSPTKRWSNTFDAVLKKIEEEHPSKLLQEPSMVNALNAFVKAIDAHASLLGGEDYTHIKHATAGGRFRTGITLGPKDDTDTFLMVLAVKKGSPAAQAGIQRYDKIKAINQIPVAPFSLEENAARLTHTTDSSPVTLLISREYHEPITYSLRPAFLQKKSCHSRSIG